MNDQSKHLLVIQSVSDQLYHLVRERILSGEMAAGDPIRQDTLAATFNISKIPLRETLARLEQDGLVTSYPNRGFFVSTLNGAEAEEVFRLRLDLEPEATARGAGHAQAADHEAGLEALEKLETALRDADPAQGSYNRMFHMALIRPGCGKLTEHIIETLNVIADRYVRLHLSPLGRHVRANNEHREIYEAWVANDRKKLEGLIRLHIRETLRDLRAQLP